MQAGIQRSAHFFISSFSSRGDDLGQWRAYADNGRGYALGFDGKTLEAAFTKDGETPIPNNSTFPVIYSDTQIIEIHRQIIGKMFQLISLPRGKGMQGPAINVYMAELQMPLTLHVLQTALFFKHEAYANEKEFRFLQIHKANESPTVKVRSRPYSLVRYRDFDWRKVAPLAVKQIVVGPAADAKEVQFARDCLVLFGAESVELIKSEIPYRAG